MKISTWRERLEVMRERSKSKHDGIDCTTRYEEATEMQAEIDDLRKVLESLIFEIKALPEEVITLLKANQ